MPFPGQLPAVFTPTQPNLDALPPYRPIQYLLTLKNHMFDPVRVTLATPSLTPGRVASKVTILCPQFDLGANSDVWDEALQAGPPAPSNTATASTRGGAAAGFEKVAEAGKVWDKGRNWTTVVLEVVPGTLPGSSSSDTTHHDSSSSPPEGGPLREDEDVLEIPVFVRLEWDSENQMEQDQQPSSSSSTGGRGGAQKQPDLVKRELAYWMVLGVGRIAPDAGF